MIQTTFIFLWMVLICLIIDLFTQPKGIARASPTPVVRSRTVQKVKQGTVVTEKLTSTILRENRIGLDPDRQIKYTCPRATLIPASLTLPFITATPTPLIQRNYSGMAAW